MKKMSIFLCFSFLLLPFAGCSVITVQVKVVEAMEFP